MSCEGSKTLPVPSAARRRKFSNAHEGNERDAPRESCGFDQELVGPRSKGGSWALAGRVRDLWMVDIDHASHRSCDAVFRLWLSGREAFEGEEEGTNNGPCEEF